MKLHVYDHCPFCVRARMPLGLKKISAEVLFQLNDDEATPIRMIGAKMLPILEDADGFMGESLDIVAKLDALDGRPIFGGAARPEIAAWQTQYGPTISKLTIPRTPDPVFPEFATPEARAYFTAKKSETLGDFDALIAATDAHLAALAPGLEALAELLPDPKAPSIEDILVFPILRSLSIVPQLQMPPAVADYAAAMSEASGVPLVPALRRLVA